MEEDLLSSKSSSTVSLSRTLTNLRQNSRAALGFFVQSNKAPEDQLYVYFCDESNVGVKSMRKLVHLFNPIVLPCLTKRVFRLLNILDEKGIRRGIIIYPRTMTPSARKVCQV